MRMSQPSGIFMQLLPCVGTELFDSVTAKRNYCFWTIRVWDYGCADIVGDSRRVAIRQRRLGLR